MPKKLVFPNVSSRFAASPTSPGLDQSSHVPDTFADGLPLPKVFVFDLDYTLWPFWVDTHVSTPIKPASKDPTQNTAMIDRYGESFAFYHEVPGVLYAARQKGITMGLASRTHAPDLAEKMLRNIMVTVPPEAQKAGAQEAEQSTSKESPSKAWDFFTYREIFPGSKIKHFNRIQKSTAKKGEEVAFADMLFFDDEGRNREVETQLGVTFVLVRDGVTRDEVDRGVRDWRKRRGLTQRSSNGHNDDDDEMTQTESVA